MKKNLQLFAIALLTLAGSTQVNAEWSKSLIYPALFGSSSATAGYYYGGPKGAAIAGSIGTFAGIVIGALSTQAKINEISISGDKERLITCKNISSSLGSLEDKFKKTLIHNDKLVHGLAGCATGIATGYALTKTTKATILGAILGYFSGTIGSYMGECIFKSSQNSGRKIQYQSPVFSNFRDNDFREADREYQAKQ